MVGNKWSWKRLLFLVLPRVAAAARPKTSSKFLLRPHQAHRLQPQGPSQAEPQESSSAESDAFPCRSHQLRVTTVNVGWQVAAAEAGILEFDRKNFGGQPLLWDLVKDVRLAQQEQAGEGGGPGGPTKPPPRPPNSEETYRTLKANLLRGGGAEAGQLFLTQEEAFVDRGTLTLDRPTTAEGPPPPTTELLHRLVDEDQLASGSNAFAGSEHRYLGQGSAAIGPGLQLLFGASGSLGGASGMAVRDQPQRRCHVAGPRGPSINGSIPLLPHRGYQMTVWRFPTLERAVGPARHINKLLVVNVLCPHVATLSTAELRSFFLTRHVLKTQTGGLEFSDGRRYPSWESLLPEIALILFAGDCKRELRDGDIVFDGGRELRRAMPGTTSGRSSPPTFLGFEHFARKKHLALKLGARGLVEGEKAGPSNILFWQNPEVFESFKVAELGALMFSKPAGPHLPLTATFEFTLRRGKASQHVDQRVMSSVLQLFQETEDPRNSTCAHQCQKSDCSSCNDEDSPVGLLDAGIVPPEPNTTPHLINSTSTTVQPVVNGAAAANKQHFSFRRLQIVPDVQLAREDEAWQNHDAVEEVCVCDYDFEIEGITRSRGGGGFICPLRAGQQFPSAGSQTQSESLLLNADETQSQQPSSLLLNADEERQWQRRILQERHAEAQQLQLQDNHTYSSVALRREFEVRDNDLHPDFELTPQHHRNTAHQNTSQGTSLFAAAAQQQLPLRPQAGILDEHYRSGVLATAQEILGAPTPQQVPRADNPSLPITSDRLSSAGAGLVAADDSLPDVILVGPNLPQSTAAGLSHTHTPTPSTMSIPRGGDRYNSYSRGQVLGSDLATHFGTSESFDGVFVSFGAGGTDSGRLLHTAQGVLDGLALAAEDPIHRGRSKQLPVYLLVGDGELIMGPPTAGAAGGGQQHPISTNANNGQQWGAGRRGHQTLTPDARPFAGSQRAAGTSGALCGQQIEFLRRAFCCDPASTSQTILQHHFDVPFLREGRAAWWCARFPPSQTSTSRRGSTSGGFDVISSILRHPQFRGGTGGGKKQRLLLLTGSNVNLMALANQFSSFAHSCGGAYSFARFLEMGGVGNAAGFEAYAFKSGVSSEWDPFATHEYLNGAVVPATNVGMAPRERGGWAGGPVRAAPLPRSSQRPPEGPGRRSATEVGHQHGQTTLLIRRRQEFDSGSGTDPLASRGGGRAFQSTFQRRAGAGASWGIHEEENFRLSRHEEDYEAPVMSAFEAVVD